MLQGPAGADLRRWTKRASKVADTLQTRLPADPLQDFPGPDLHVGVCGSLAARSPQSHGPGQARFAYGSARAGLAFDLGALARGERGCAAVWGVHIMTMKYVGDQYDMANVCCGTSDTYQLTEI